MSWSLLFIAGLFEVLWTVGLKLSSELYRPWIVAGTSAALLASIILLGLSMRHLPLSTAYAVWTGIGSLGAFAVGVIWFHEPLNAGRILIACILVAGMVGMKLTSQ